MTTVPRYAVASVDDFAGQSDRPTWYGHVPDALAARAQELAQYVAAELNDPQRLVELVVSASDQAVHPGGWEYPGFAHGHAGVALLHLSAARASSDEANEKRSLETAFDYLREAVFGTQIEPLETPALFFGTSGLALCLADCARTEPRFHPALAQLHENLAGQTAEMNLTFAEKQVADSDYDVVSGAAGVLSYLCTIEEPDPALGTAVNRLLEYLVWLGGEPEDPLVPHRWLITPENYSPHELAMRPETGGYLNVGTAHGIPGAATAVASAMRAGYRCAGDEDALRRMTSWILAIMQVDEDGPLWPAEVLVSADGRELPADDHQDQLAWCYGTAGVAVSLLTASEALGDDVVRRTAVEAFEAVLRRTKLDGSLTPTFCHGKAGLLAICMEFADRTASALVHESVPVLLRELIDFADSSRPLLFADQDEPGNRVDSPALLVGATGVALTLFAAIDERRPVWLSAFLAR